MQMSSWFFILPSTRHSGYFLSACFGGVEVTVCGKTSNSSEEEEIASWILWISNLLMSAM
jgi:hypothetical protein